MSESSSTIDVCSETLSPDTAWIDHRKWPIFFLELSHRLSTPEINLNNLQHTEAEWLLLHPIVDAAGDPLPPTPRLPNSLHHSLQTHPMLRAFLTLEATLLPQRAENWLLSLKMPLSQAVEKTSQRELPMYLLVMSMSSTGRYSTTSRPTMAP